MNGYSLPVTGYRAQCLQVHAADRLTLFVEWREGLFERLDAKLRGVVVPKLAHTADCGTQYRGCAPECTFESEDEYQRAQAAREWVEDTVQNRTADARYTTEDADLGRWPLRVTLSNESGSWVGEVWWHNSSHEWQDGECVNCRCNNQKWTGRCESGLAAELIRAGHAQPEGDE